MGTAPAGARRQSVGDVAVLRSRWRSADPRCRRSGRRGSHRNPLQRFVPHHSGPLCCFARDTLGWSADEPAPHGATARRRRSRWPSTKRKPPSRLRRSWRDAWRRPRLGLLLVMTMAGLALHAGGVLDRRRSQIEAPSSPSLEAARVDRPSTATGRALVRDGDTIVVGGVPVRLQGLHCPELAKRAAEPPPTPCGAGRWASRFNAR